MISFRQIAPATPSRITAPGFAGFVPKMLIPPWAIAAIGPTA
jgi:hypothetical protein